MKMNNTGLTNCNMNVMVIDQTRLLNIEGYSHPNDQNLQIYPERRDTPQWTEQIEMTWFDPIPITKAQKRKEELSLRELGA